MRKQIAAANWKMNLTIHQAKELAENIINAPIELKPNQLVVLGVPFPYLAPIQKVVGDKEGFFIAAQNLSNKKSGAFTGEVSAEMLQSLGIKYVIIGHSERREYYNETNGVLAEKLNIALEYGLTPIFCCGEPLYIREEERQNAFVAEQLKESLYHLSAEDVSKIVIAYEPIWAIGTGKTATSEQAQEIQAFIRSELTTKYGADVSESIPVLYGGSVKANNAVEIFGQKDVDGGLVGGASLIASEFIAIINSLKA